MPIMRIPLRYRLPVFFTLLGVAWIAGAPSVRAQDKPKLTIASAPAMPGSEVRVTVRLTNGAAALTQIRQWIEYPKDKLSYFGSRLSLAGEMAEAELKAETEDKPGGDSNTGILVVSMTSKKPLSDGPIVELLLNVSPTAGDETINLGYKGEAGGPDVKEPIPVETEGGSMTIAKNPSEVPGLFSCFFYMH
jgi:hypothetical protein